MAVAGSPEDSNAPGGRGRRQDRRCLTGVPWLFPSCWTCTPSVQQPEVPRCLGWPALLGHSVGTCPADGGGCLPHSLQGGPGFLTTSPQEPQRRGKRGAPGWAPSGRV